MLVEQYFSETLLLKFEGVNLYQVGETAIQPLATHLNFIVSTSGVHILNKGEIRILREYKETISKAVISETGFTVLELPNRVEYFHLT